MRFYLGYINHLGRLQKKSARLVRQAHQPVRQAGFTITEVLLASLMMVIVISVSGIGVTNLLRSNYRANAGTEIQNNLNRTLEFVSDDVRRAKTIADSETAITSTQVPTGARAVLAFQISDPNNPSQILPHQIVYYTKGPENSLTGPRVLWRYGPNLDPNGNYITPDQIATWQHSPVTDRLAAAASNPNCPTGFTRIPTLGNVDDFYTAILISKSNNLYRQKKRFNGWQNCDRQSVLDGCNFSYSVIMRVMTFLVGVLKSASSIKMRIADFYTCVRTGGGQVILNANAQVNLTTGDTDKDKVNYSVSTRVSPRATN